MGLMSERLSVAVSKTECQMAQIVLPTHTNNHDTCFGGQIAAWADICAGISANRYCRRPVVTASMDELHFLRPVKRGMVVLLQSQVNQSWSTSLEVGVRIVAEDPVTGERMHCCSAYLTFVALASDSRPTRVPLPDFEGNTEWERRGREANARREARLEMRKRREAGM